MKRKFENYEGCLIWLVIGGVIIIYEIPIILFYLLLATFGLVVLIFILDLFYTIFLLILHANYRSIFTLNEKRLLSTFEQIGTLSSKESIELDEKYLRFISSTMIFKH